ncbi:hypothetical protein GCM10027030_00930 [Luteococcus sediminum]
MIPPPATTSTMTATGCEPSVDSPSPWRRRFDRFRDGLWSLFPQAIRHHLPVTLVGYCLINLLTFSTDMALLWFGFRVASLPYPVAVSAGYIVALALAYALNRTLNFESNSPVGGELARYVVTVVVNYALLVVGLSSLLHHVGVHF